jgi:hypothetical protein
MSGTCRTTTAQNPIKTLTLRYLFPLRFGVNFDSGTTTVLCGEPYRNCDCSDLYSLNCHNRPLWWWSSSLSLRCRSRNICARSKNCLGYSLSVWVWVWVYLSCHVKESSRKRAPQVVGSSSTGCSVPRASGPGVKKVLRPEQCPDARVSWVEEAAAAAAAAVEESKGLCTNLLLLPCAWRGVADSWVP